VVKVQQSVQCVEKKLKKRVGDFLVVLFFYSHTDSRQQYRQQSVWSRCSLLWLVDFGREDGIIYNATNISHKHLINISLNLSRI